MSAERSSPLRVAGGSLCDKHHINTELACEAFFSVLPPDSLLPWKSFRHLANGVFLEFYNNGALEKIACKDGVSSDFIPVSIQEFVKVRYPDAYFTEYKVDKKHYEVKSSKIIRQTIIK